MKYHLEIVAFLVGASVMALEIVGSRIVAPYLGTSIIVWTSLIGVVLASLSLGYFLGGRLADRQPNEKILSLILAFSTFAVAFVALTKEALLGSIQSLNLDIRLGAFLAATLLLAPASTLLGMISPYLIRLKLKSLTTSGGVAGRIYAISTLGSIVGTFAAGYFLLAYLGNTRIVVLIVVILAFCTFLTSKIAGLKMLAAVAVVGAFFGSSLISQTFVRAGLVDVDTHYNRVWIFDATDRSTGRKAKVMKFDPRYTQSGMYLDSDELVFSYTKFFHLASHFKTNLEQVLIIGGAAYSFPRDLLAKYPQIKVDVVEIDPGVTELAKKYFRLAENSRLQIFHEDGRTFINKEGEARYDVIFEDAFGNASSVPYHLTTIEASQRLYSLLKEDGVVFVNLISSIEGEKGKFLQAEYKTYKSVFPQVFIFPMVNQDPFQVQNIVLVALKSKEEPSFSSSDSTHKAALEKIYKGKIPDDIPVLTDEFAPVDNYLSALE